MVKFIKIPCQCLGFDESIKNRLEKSRRKHLLKSSEASQARISAQSSGLPEKSCLHSHRRTKGDNDKF